MGTGSLPCISGGCLALGTRGRCRPAAWEAPGPEGRRGCGPGPRPLRTQERVWPIGHRQPKGMLVVSRWHLGDSKQPGPDTRPRSPPATACAPGLCRLLPRAQPGAAWGPCASCQRAACPPLPTTTLSVSSGPKEQQLPLLLRPEWLGPL